MSGIGETNRPPGLLFDSDVLIDYSTVAEDLLALIAEHLGPAAALTTTVAEVRRLEPVDCIRRGIEVVEVTPEQYSAAAVLASGMARNDDLCLAVCRDLGWTLATNDRDLRRRCAREGVRTRWGLELMLDLVSLGVLTRVRAEAIAAKLHEASPGHFPRSLVDEFGRQLGRLRRPGSGGGSPAPPEDSDARK